MVSKELNKIGLQGRLAYKVVWEFLKMNKAIFYKVMQSDTVTIIIYWTSKY